MASVVLLVIALALGALAQVLVRFVYGRASRCEGGVNATGAIAARGMLDVYGQQRVAVCRGGHILSDHYSLDARAVILSEETYCGRNAAAVAIACHECAHAVQHSNSDRLLKTQDLLELPTRVSACIWIAVLLVGIVAGSAALRIAGAAILAVAILCQLAFLPIELGASRMAYEHLSTQAGGEGLPTATLRASRKMLQASLVSHLMAPLTGPFDLLSYSVGFLVREQGAPSLKR